MSNKLFYFLVKMGEDLDVQRRYRDNPEVVMREYKLTPKEQELLLEGDEADIQRSVVGTAGDFVVFKNWQICKNWTKPPKPKR